VRCNQVGYLPDGPKRAVWVTDAEAPAPFRVLDRDGGTIATGATVPWAVRPEPTSGLRVHELEFSGVRAEGAGFVVEVGGARSHPFAIAPDLYAPLRDDALRFFYLQRSGVAIDDARAPGYGRPAGHAGDTAVAAWSGADARRLYPGWSCPGRFDVSGGWYDAGDHGKYVTSGAMAVWQLLATIELLRRRGADPAAEAVLAEECRWQLDWLLRMQVPPGRMHAGLAFHRLHGTEWAPLPCRPHEDPTTRVLHRPSTAAGLHLAAAVAHGARVFAGDAAYARRLLEAATTAYRAAQAEPELLAPDDHGAFGGGPYAHDDLGGDWAWAAAELWLASRDPAYAATAARAAEAGAIAPDGFDCDRMAAAGALDLALHGAPAETHDAVVATVIDAADRLVELQAGSPWGEPYAPPDGWSWGSNGRILANLVVLAVAHELSGRAEHRAAAARGMDHLLGCNALGQSYVTGYGTDATRHQRTRHFAHDLDPSFPPPPPGALAGGPTSKEHPGFPTDPRLRGLPPQQCYLDEPTSETTNDVCIRWNAPLVHMAAFLTPA